MVKTPPNIFLNKSPRKNLAFIVAVSNPYIHELKQNWDRLSDWDICVLTDKPEEFENAFYVEMKYSATFISLLLLLEWQLSLKEEASY